MQYMAKYVQCIIINTYNLPGYQQCIAHLNNQNAQKTRREQIKKITTYNSNHNSVFVLQYRDNCLSVSIVFNYIQ